MLRAVTRREQILDTAAEPVRRARLPRRLGARHRRGLRHLRARRSTSTSPARRTCWPQSLTSISETPADGGSSSSAPRPAIPTEALDALIDWHVEFALAHPALIVIQDREWTNLGAAARRDVRELQLAYIDIWVDTLRELRPDLDRAPARAAVQATFGLLNSTPHCARISADAMARLLASMARDALLAP